MSATRFEDLIAWQKARDLTVAIYTATGRGAFAKDFGLRDQIQRASVSVMSNLVGGFDRFSRPEFAHFLAISRGSAAEVRSQLYVAHALGYLNDQNFQELHRLSIEVSRLVTSLRTAVART